MKRKRRRKTRHLRPVLDVPQILAWADAFHERTGHWPLATSGPIPESAGDTWQAVHSALRCGNRGLPGGSSLARLLAEHRGKRNEQDLPPYTEEQILLWADAYFQRTQSWPNGESGPIAEAPGETWGAVDRALYSGGRGLPGGSSLARLLARARGVRNPRDLPPLTKQQILLWAVDHHERTGQWPDPRSGPVLCAPEENWNAIESALKLGFRGLPGGSSVAKLLRSRRQVRNRGDLPALTEEQILQWARDHHKRTGHWPTGRSGSIPHSGGETWTGVNSALVGGCRGLPGGSSLTKLLAEHGLKRNPQSLLPLTFTGILRWADIHHEETGQWPTRNSGRIHHTRGETWAGVDAALREGRRGLRGGSTLAQLLASRRGVRNHMDLPPRTVEQILNWADAHHQRTGTWPSARSGPIADAPGEEWNAVNQALVLGHRGLAGGITLARLLAEHRGVPHPADRPRLTTEQILAWADGYHERTGRWPSRRSGAILEAQGETWLAVEAALAGGWRGLPGGSSLAKLLDAHGRRGTRRTTAPDEPCPGDPTCVDPGELRRS
jgi:hypothetical protein